jgi:hypothetical protein
MGPHMVELWNNDTSYQPLKRMLGQVRRVLAGPPAPGRALAGALFIHLPVLVTGPEDDSQELAGAEDKHVQGNFPNYRASERS